MSRADFEPLAWANRGIPRDEAERLYDAGFDLGEAVDWRGRFGTHDAIRWRAAGVTTLREARAWLVAGVNAVEVAGWQQAGIGFAEAAGLARVRLLARGGARAEGEGHVAERRLPQAGEGSALRRGRQVPARSWLPDRRHRWSGSSRSCGTPATTA